MSIRRTIVFQPDLLEWVSTQRGPIKYLRDERYKLEKGFIAYGKIALTYLPGGKKDVEAVARIDEEALTKSRAAADRSMAQFHDSEDLLKRMKWKRVTWEDDADYTGFAKRVLDNDGMFKHAPAFSFMSIHIVKDPTTTDCVVIPPAGKSIEEGSLTNWVLRERDPQVVGAYPLRDLTERCSAFTVDWVAGEVRILDTASAQEILTFITTVAPRLQALQVKMTEQQTKQAEEVENVRIRVGVTIKFNEFDTSYWDDPKRRTDPNYVSPADMEKFLNGMLKAACLYRRFLKGQQIRVVAPGRPYCVDLDTQEIQVPANFAEYSWLRAHTRFERVEKIFSSCRRFWWVWFCVGMVIVGDSEIL